MSEAARNRLHVVDALRAISILYIVGFWHLLEYAPAMPYHWNRSYSSLTTAVLGIFVFISGLLLGRRELQLNAAELKEFYLRRVLRIYPLYFISLVIFVLVSLTDVTTAAKSALGIAMLAGPPPYTLWFIAMLFWFYLLAPLLISQVHRVLLCVAIAACLTALFGLAGLILPHADKRLFIYFPSFAAGILSSALGAKPTVGQALLCSALALAAAAANTLPELGMVSVMLSAVIALFGALSAYSWVEIVAPNVGRHHWVVAISYASFAMYLFHRPILGGLMEVFLPKTLLAQLLYLFLVCLPVILVVAWVIQRLYDRVLNIRKC